MVVHSTPWISTLVNEIPKGLGVMKVMQCREGLGMVE